MTRAGGSSPAGVVLKCVVTVAAVVLAAYLVWGLRSLILPASVGGLLAYICRPLVARIERYWIPRGLAVGLLLLMVALITLVVANSIRAVMPSETQALELRVRALYALNQRYQALMGLDPSWTRGNRLYQLTHRDLDPLVDGVSELLSLAPDERPQFVASLERGTEAASARSNRLLDYDRANAQAVEMRALRTGRAGPAPGTPGESPSSPAPTSAAKSGPAGLGDILSTWMIAPLIFLFLLWDTGTIKRGLLRAVPNRLFEPALAVLADVDQALGDYVRGIVLECCSLGLTVIVFIVVVGVPLRWAIPIGIFTGASNVVPYMGLAAALLSGLAYALLAEDVHALLPLVTAETFAIWVVAAVALAELLKNIVYEPIILGGAVKLHPLVMVIGVVGGAILFGPAGMLLAIPTITIVKVLVASTARHLVAYGLV
ncbi:MAG TPA: AI-2E family transporter [Candidatus Methylomirabilis sp.]|nr:AI-2E family transporter [Candidatus Methylomirabilis sp.]